MSLNWKIFRKTPFTIQRRKIEMQRNLWLASAQLSFLLLVGNNEVGDSICEIFGGITHLVWTFFWVWTGIQKKHQGKLHIHNFYRIGRLLSLFFRDTCIWKFSNRGQKTPWIFDNYWLLFTNFIGGNSIGLLLRPGSWDIHQVIDKEILKQTQNSNKCLNKLRDVLYEYHWAVVPFCWAVRQFRSLSTI